MEDNKLTYYVEINTEDGTQKALKKLMKFNKEAQDAIKGVTEKSSANDKVAGLKKQLDELSKTWDKYNASQRKGDAGSKTIKEFRELEGEAGAFAGRLRQVIKAQDEKSASATQLYAKLQALRKEWRELTAAELNGAKGRAIIDKYNEIMKSSAAAGLSLDSYVKKLQKQSAEHEKSVKAVTGLRSEIKNLETQWNKLTLTQQKGAEGQRLKNQIRALRDEYGKYGLSLKQTVINEDRVNSNRLKTQASANSLSGRIRLLTAEWNKLTAAQRSGAEGQRILAQFQRLNNEAGNYAGTLNQASKNQIKLATSTTATNTGLYRQSRIMSQLKSQIGMYVSVYALQRFATAVRDITAEFELQRVALTAILQDKAAADKIFGQVVELALESPFRIKNIISYTKQLAAYRVETDKLFDTTKRLADISAGLGVDMSRLILAYGQVRAASVLRGQELRQFTEAGIPLVKLLADKFTELRGVMVSTGEVFELISKRAVPFRMIEEIFNDMTDAGGMFYNMQKIQAETIHGVWANLKDAYDKMYYEIGQKNMGLLKGLGNFLRSLADNWEAVYISMKTVVSGYLSYLAVSKLVLTSTKVLTIAQIAEATASGRQVKATLAKTLSTTLATKAADLHTAAQLRAAVATNVLSRAFWKLTAAIMANPIAAAIGLFVAAGAVIAGFARKANDLDNIIKKLSKSTSEYNKINDEIKPALETYGDLNKIAAKSEDQTKKQANALATLAQKYPAAITKVDEYGRAIEVSAEMVSKLMLAEEELEKQRIENSNKELLRQKAILVSKMNSLKADINSGYYTQTLSGREGGSQRIPMTPSLLAAWNKEIGELGVRVQKIDVALKGTGSAAAGEIEEALAGLKEYVFKLESLEKRAGGNRIKLYDAEEDVSAFGSHIELLEDVAKKYDEANKHAKFYSEQVTNPKISESERETYKNDLRIANAEKELARNILDRYKALDLIKKLKAGDEETENVKRLREEINVAKDARAAYENYLKTMTEVRAKQTLEGQLKFAGLNFDISDAGAYRGYLQNIYDNIKGDPNYDAVRKLIEDIFVDLDTNAIERELKIKLNKIANDIEKIQKANDFFEKVLGITGDIELSKAITIKFTGVAAGEVGDKLREQLQETLQTALGDQALDISGLDILQIEELINKIPDTMTDVKDKAKSFFDKFSDYIRETKIEALELDEQLKLLGMDDSAFFGTGVVLDVQKVVRDLSMANKKLAKEKSQLEAEVAADIRANDKKWYDERMKYIDDSFRRSMANEKTLAQEKLNDLAKSMFEERRRMLGIDDLLNDISDKSMGQINEAIKRINEMAELKVLEIPESVINALELYGYEIDNIAESDLDGIFEKTGELISEDEQRIIRLVVSMKELGVSTKELNSAYAKLVGQQKKDTSDEKQKRQRDMLISSAKEVVKLTNSISEMAEAMDDDRIAGLTSTLGSLADVIESIASGAKTGGWVGAIVSAVATIADMLVGDFKKIGELKNAVADSKLEAWVKSVNELYESEGIFGETFFMGTRESIDAAAESMKKYNKVLGEATKLYADTDPETQWRHNYGNPLGFISNWLSNVTVKIFGTQTDLFAQKDAYIEAFKNAYEAGYNEVEAFVLRINDRGGFFNFFGWQDKFAALKDVVEELGYELYDKGGILNTEALQAALTTYGDEMTDAQKRWVEEAIAATEEYANAMSALDDYVSDLFGNLASDIASSMIDSFKEIGVAAYGLEGIFVDISESIINNLLQTMLIEEVLNKYSESLKAIMKDTSLTDEERANAMLDIMNDMRVDILAFAQGKNAFLEAAKQAGLLNMPDMSSGDFGAEDWAKAIAEIDALIASMMDNAGGYNEELLNNLRKELDDIVNSIGLMEQRLGEEMTALLSERPEEGTKAYEEWAQRVAELEDKFLSLGISYEEYLTKQDRYKELLREIAVMEDRYADNEAIKLLLKQKKELLDKIYEAGYGKYATDEMKQDETLKEYLADIEFYNQLANEATDPEQQERWRRLAELAKAAFDNAVIDDFNTKLDESLSKFDDNIDKMAFLKNMLSSLSDQTKIDEVKRQLEELGGIVYKDLYSTYADDAQKYKDELADMNKHMEWAIENGYPELAEWIQKAYDTKVLENWQTAINEIADDIDNDVEKYRYFQAELQKAAAGLIMAILSGDTTAQADWEEKMKWLLDIIDGLKGSITDNLWDDYATDAQKYEKELEKINQDLLDALDLYPELADEIADAFNTRVLDEWKDKWDDVFGDMESNADRLAFIEQELAGIGVPEVSEEDARKGRDAALLSGDDEALNYYQQQLLMHMKINLLLEEREAIEDSLYNSYRSERQELGDNVREIENDIKAMKDLRDQATDPNDIAKWNEAIQNAEKEKQELINNYNLDGLEKEFEKQFGDISDMGTDEVKKMLDAFKQQIEDSDISEEQKKKILEDIDDIYDELDRRTQEAFNNIADAIRSIKSLLETVGADRAIVDSFGAIADAIGIIGDLTYAIASGNWWNVFNLAIKLINATISAIKNLVQYFKGDPFAGVEAIGVRITNAEKAVQKAVGTSVKPAQESLLSAYQDAIDELNKGIAKEEAKPDGFFAKLFGLDTDEEAIAKAKEQIADYEDLMDEVRESMKADFLQTDYTSFSDSLAEILIAPWDSYMEMMDAVKELTDQTINNIVKHALSLHIQAQVKDALDALYERGIGDESLEMFRDDVRKIVQDGQQVAQYYGQFYDDLASSSTAYDTISRITESQANSFLGYYQNYLIIMTDMHNIMKRIWDNMNRQSVNINLDAHLTALHTIAANTGAIANNTSRIGAMADDIRIMKNSLARSGAY